MILLVGWLFIGQLALQVRRGRWPRQALATDVEAGAVAYETPTRSPGRGRPRLGPRPAVPGEPRHPLNLPAGAVMAGLIVAAAFLAVLLVGPDRHRYDRRLLLPGAADRRQGGRGHGHLEGVRKYTLTNLHGVARGSTAGWPRTCRRSSSPSASPGYSGHFTSAEVSKPLGDRSGTLAVAVVTTPANRLLGTLVLSKIPVRFQHTHPF